MGSAPVSCASGDRGASAYPEFLSVPQVSMAFPIYGFRMYSKGQWPSPHFPKTNGSLPPKAAAMTRQRLSPIP